MARERILLIDGSGYFFRAFYAIKSLSNSKGFPTNAVYGFVNMLLKTLETEKPKYLAIAFDTGRDTFRKERYPAYKANRSAAPDDLKVQIPVIFKAVDAFGIHRLEKIGFEADDLIGTIAKRAVEDGYDVEIITGDKDLMQLVNDSVSLYDSMKDKRINADAVKEKFGVLPHQIVDLLALMGDSSDNIPGVSGIGEKTAAELIQKFGSLDNIYESLEQIPQAKRRETLKAEKEMAYLSQELATVKCDVDIPLEWNSFKYDGPNKPELCDVFQDMEFYQLIKRMGLEPTTEDGVTKGNQSSEYVTIRTATELTALLTKLSTAPIVSVDTETTGLHPHDAKLVGVSLSAASNTGFYIPIGHVELGTTQLQGGQIDGETARHLLKPFLESSTPKKTGQNLKFDIQILRAWGVDLGGVEHDTLIASYLIDASGAHNLDALAMRYLGHQTTAYSEVTGKGKAQINFSEVAIDKATAYSAEDADIAFRLTEKLEPLLKERDCEKLYQDLEMPLSQVLAAMEYAGIQVEKNKLEVMGRDLEAEMKTIESKIYEAAGAPFNIQSPKQLGDVLFDKLLLPVIKKTKTGRSTDESVLQALSEKHQICENILKFRGLAKLRSTYVEGLISQIHPATGRVHTHFNQTVTATGRLSSTEPNMQNIPVAAETGYNIRSVFVAPPGHTLMSADYSQIELRILAHMSQDPGLSKAFANDEDIHEATARFMFNVTDVSPEHRRIAKTINFGVVYGQTAYGLSSMLKISPGEAKGFIDSYFARYSHVKQFFQTIIETARTTGYVSTMLGRRRYLPDLKADNRMTREIAERAAINAPVQGSAADLIKIAMLNIAKRLKQERLASTMLLQVHDELVFEVPDAEIPSMRALIRDGMENAMHLSVPLKVVVGEGRNWGDC